MAKRVYQSTIVEIQDKDKNIIGTGLFINEQYIITCAHVICNGYNYDIDEVESKSIYIRFPFYDDNLSKEATVIYATLDNKDNEVPDIALLKLNQIMSISSYPLIENIEHNEKLDVFGFEIFEGRWVSVNYNGLIKYGLVQLSSIEIINEGFSGAPVWHLNNQGVAGIIVSKSTKIEASYMIPSSVILGIPEIKKHIGECSISKNPYKGLNAFESDDVQFYFGRENDINEVVNKLNPKFKNNFFSLIGMSGVGKSSFINAGVIPKVKNQFGYEVIKLRPSDNPFKEMARVLSDYFSEDKHESFKKALVLEKDLGSSDLNSLKDTLDYIVYKDIHPSPLLIIIDQFEELFTNSTPKIQKLFLEKVMKVIKESNSNIKILISMRIDFLEKLLNYPEYANIFNDDTKYFLSHLEIEQLETIIVKPAKLQNIKFEDGLLERITDEVKDEKGLLPLIEFALTKLWEKQSKGFITHESLTDLGGVLASIGKYAEDIYKNLTLQEQESAKRIMIQLIHPGEEHRDDTRQIASINDFIEEDKRVIEKLATARLVVTGDSENRRQVEIVHEALISKWSRLEKWINEFRAFRVWQNKTKYLKDDWDKAKKDESYLLRGRQLEEAQDFLERYPKELGIESNKDEQSTNNISIQEFINESSKVVEREKEKKLKKDRQIKFGIILFIAILLITTIYSLWQKNIADERLSTISAQRKQVIWTYWSTLINIDRQDNKIDDIELLNVTLDILGYPSQGQEKAIEILVNEAITKLKREEPSISKTLIDFDIYMPKLFSGDFKYITNQFSSLSENAIWAWDNNQLNLFVNLTEKLSSMKTTNNESLTKELIANKKVQYLSSLFSFAANPTIDTLETLKLKANDVNGSFEIALNSILNYESNIKYNIFYYFDNNFTKKLTDKELFESVKLYSHRIQSIGNVLKNDIEKSDSYSVDMKKNIKNMHNLGLFELKSDGNTNRFYPSLRLMLPSKFKTRYKICKRDSNLTCQQINLEKILEIEPHNPWALDNLAYLFFEKGDKNITFFSKEKDFLKEWKQILLLVLNNQDFDVTIKNLTDKKEDKLSDMYLTYVGWLTKKEFRIKSILNLKLALKYMKNIKDKSTYHGSLSWYYIFTHEYQNSIDSALKGIELNKENIWIYGNLAHAYLLSGKKDKAIEIYKKYQGKKILSSKRLWEDTVKEDFRRFRDKNITSEYFNIIENILNIKN